MAWLAVFFFTFPERSMRQVHQVQISTQSGTLDAHRTRTRAASSSVPGA